LVQITVNVFDHDRLALDRGFDLVQLKHDVRKREDYFRFYSPFSHPAR